MNTELVQATADQILRGAVSFPEAVRALRSADVEYYHVDYANLRKRFYGNDGAVVTSPIRFEGLPDVAAEFDAAGLEAAILDSQRHGQSYRDFSRRAMAAGVQGYFAFLRGKRVTYLGRQGDQHIEWFPGARPAIGKD